MADCKTCKYAEWDYEEYFGGAKKAFVCDCTKGEDYLADDCEAHEERKEDLESYRG